MHILPPTPRSLDLAVAALAAGGVVIHPTETCYGIACDLTNPAAVARLFSLKKRPEDQPVSALFSSIEQAKRYVLWNSHAEALARQHLPGPLTLILPLRPDAPHRLHTTPSRTSELGHRTEVRTLGIRISSHPVAQKLVTLFGRPISTTSANISGKPPTYSAEEIIAQFSGLEGAQDILVLDAGPLPHAPPSTVLCIGDDVTVLREGCLSPSSRPHPAPSAEA